MPRIVVFAVFLAAASGSLAIVPPSPTRAQAPSQVREIEIVVQGGYHPNRVTIREGERVRLRFVRRETSMCSRYIVLPWLNVRRELPPNQPVIIDLPAMRAGSYEFRCGMNMLRGTIVVTPR